MRRRQSILLLFVGLILAALAWAAVAQTTGRTALGAITIKANRVEGTLRGTVTYSSGVTVTTRDMTLTCDTLKVWPAKSSREFDRIEATGNVKLKGTYTATDKTKWSVNGSSQRADFDNRARVGKLTGGVDLRAVNQTDKSTVSAKADTFTYNQKTQTFHMERNGEPVSMQWEPAPSAGGGGAAK